MTPYSTRGNRENRGYYMDNIVNAILTRNMVAALTLALSVSAWKTRAGEVGHFAPGVPNIRDFVVPAPGFYGVLYTYNYGTTQINDANGNRIDSITIDPPGLTLDVDVDVDLYAIAPTFIWVSDWKILGAKYGAYVNLTLANSSVGAALNTVEGDGRSIDTSQFDIGDIFVQPLWLGWSLAHFDFALGYGFYAPSGRYSTMTVDTLLGPIKTTSPDNIGLGFWTHQIGGGASWYPWAHQATAVALGMTYEIHQKKEGFDITPGQNFTLNYGISQFLPLNKGESLLLEIGPKGYSSWQITDDTGSDVIDPSVHDQVHGVGGQLGITYVPWVLSANFHGFYEYAAVDRFQGWSIGLNIAKQF